LAVLEVLLYPPGNLDKTSLLKGIFAQFLGNTLPVVIKDEIVGNESFDGSNTGRISMIVDHIFSGLGIFTQARPDVVAESHDVKKEITDRILIFANSAKKCC
jgi:hypothetical protein